MKCIKSLTRTKKQNRLFKLYKTIKMRNSVAKKLRKEAGNQQSTSNKLEYEYLKKEHMKTEVFPKIKRSKRQLRIGKVWKTKPTGRFNKLPKVSQLLNKLKA